MALPPPQVSAAPPATAPRGRRPWIAVVTGIVGIAAGLLIGILAFGGDDEAADAPEGGTADATAGCLLLANLPDEIPERLDDDDWSLDGPFVWRLQAAGTAFRAAANADREYRRLGEDGETVYRGLQTFDIDSANDALGNLQDWCAENDPGAD